MIHSIFDRIGAPILFILFVLLFIFETKFQLRKRIQNRWQRILTNLLSAIPSFALLRFLFLPVMVWLAYKNEALHIGLNYLYALPSWIEASIAFLVLDYGNYLWHVLNHKVPLLWRFHLVHHTDPDLDITTAFRFHFGEMIGSLFFRGAFVFLTGATPLIVLIYEIVFEAATQFHHCNWKLPIRLEKVLNKIVVTPRMHGIHHSVVKLETDSNYSVIFSCWDRLHNTIRLNVKQRQIISGVASYNDPEELTTGFLFKLPFSTIRPFEKATETGKDDSWIDKEKLAE